MDELLKEISEKFSLAEEKIKLIEEIEEGYLTPPINQLRYVTCHILRFHNSNDNTKKKDELRKAKNHCERATYDAVEIGILYYLNAIKSFKEAYKRITISDVVPNYIEICSHARKTNDFVSKISKLRTGSVNNNQDTHSNNQGDYYKECLDYFNELKKMLFI